MLNYFSEHPQLGVLGAHDHLLALAMSFCILLQQPRSPVHLAQWSFETDTAEAIEIISSWASTKPKTASTNENA
jgi:hypothetical protein